MLGGRLRGGVRGVLAFVIAEEEFVNIAKAGEGRCVPSVRFSKVSGGKEGALSDVTELASPLHKTSGG